jgi:hypothetical protein
MTLDDRCTGASVADQKMFARPTQGLVAEIMSIIWPWCCLNTAMKPKFEYRNPKQILISQTI